MSRNICNLQYLVAINPIPDCIEKTVDFVSWCSYNLLTSIPVCIKKNCKFCILDYLNEIYLHQTALKKQPVLFLQIFVMKTTNFMLRKKKKEKFQFYEPVFVCCCLSTMEVMEFNSSCCQEWHLKTPPSSVDPVCIVTFCGKGQTITKTRRGEKMYLMICLLSSENVSGSSERLTSTLSSHVWSSYLQCLECNVTRLVNRPIASDSQGAAVWSRDVSSVHHTVRSR